MLFSLMFSAYVINTTKGGVTKLGAVKILALPKKGGGLTYAKIFWWICLCTPKTLLRHHSTQIMIIYPQKVSTYPPKLIITNN